MERWWTALKHSPGLCFVGLRKNMKTSIIGVKNMIRKDHFPVTPCAVFSNVRISFLHTGFCKLTYTSVDISCRDYLMQNRHMLNRQLKLHTPARKPLYKQI
jgi:hypothetical protein